MTTIRRLTSWVRHPLRMRLDEASSPHVCTCRRPRPEPVVLFDALTLRDVLQCSTCGRPLLVERRRA